MFVASQLDAVMTKRRSKICWFLDVRCDDENLWVVKVAVAVARLPTISKINWFLIVLQVGNDGFESALAFIMTCRISYHRYSRYIILCIGKGANLLLILLNVTVDHIDLTECETVHTNSLIHCTVIGVLTTVSHTVTCRDDFDDPKFKLWKVEL